jgi:hypothetical protein
MIDYCYNLLVDSLVEASKSFYIKKSVNSIGKWSAELNAKFKGKIEINF